MILYGASGHAKVIINIFKLNRIKINAIIDDNKDINTVLEYTVKRLNEVKLDKEVIISIGNNKVRKTIYNKLKIEKYTNAIHSKAVIDSSSIINKGTVIMANAVINSSSIIGEHCIINTNAIIEHDCIVNNFAHISPNATLCGNVKIGEGTHIGAGAIVLPNIKIGKWCIIGAGSIVIKNIPDNTTVVGNPAKVIKSLAQSNT
ncbi:MAG: acetyltransferase [Flavobacteriaceae bacterium]|nr:acetyltransferase [Flavobacteriaceae bacterium]